MKNLDEMRARIEAEIERVKRHKLEGKDYDEWWAGYVSGLHQALAWMPVAAFRAANREGETR